ncbi:ATP-binding protein [Colwellia echini]|uniref:histidine kinase n=1 Tax=Colwellia echini TaxID=1982103 RepID=A0ABY3MTJ5_9GAMM|nr:ATP-binding protein [Colwellia echini]TYK64517.1 HAMP domain-containing protein [Colwellia echini]
MKIQNKLFLFLFSFSLVLVTVLVLLMQWSIGKGMVEYVVSKEVETLKPVISTLSETYQVDNNWQSMTNNHHKFRQLITTQLDGSDFQESLRKGPPEKNRPTRNKNLNVEDLPPHLKDKRPPPHARGDKSRADFFDERSKRPLPPSESQAHYALLDDNQQLIVGSYRPKLDYVKSPITADGVIVGYLAISKRSLITQGYELAFIEQQQYYLWLIALFVMVLVALVTLPLARHIVEPIKQITHGMHKLTQGDYQQKINLKRRDELYELSRDYNELALTLSQNETARKRWLADISHELRTPVAILRGELEAMLDKVRPLTPENISSANDEVKHLQRLIDDLNLLTSTEVGGMRYRKQHEDLIDLLQYETKKYTTYLADAGISLALKLQTQSAIIYADKDRLVQLFENIMNNCIKYANATELAVTVTLDNASTPTIAANNVIITFADNGVGVENIHLAHLFDHLYRVEDSRNRKTGGSGLGLTICRHIVLAHQGEIIAQKSTSDGLAIIVKLPLIDNTQAA